MKKQYFPHRMHTIFCLAGLILLLGLTSSLALAQEGEPLPTPLPLPPDESPTGQWKTFTQADGLADNNVRALWIGQDGTLWIGTWGGGISRYDGISWETYTTADGLAADWVLDLAGDARGSIWVASMDIVDTNAGTEYRGRGLDRFDSQTGEWTNYTTADGLPRELVIALWPDGQGGVWLGSAQIDGFDYSLGPMCGRANLTGGGLTHYDPNTDQWRTYTTADGLSDNTVTGLWGEGGGELWVATRNGVSHFEPRSEEWISYTTDDGLGGNRVAAIWGDSTGKIWAGLSPVWDPAARQSIGGGLSRFDPETNHWTTVTPVDGLGGNLVQGVWSYERNGTSHVWVANSNVAGGTCQDTGLSHWDGEQWQTITAADGLADDSVQALWGDGRGMLWAGTLDGLSLQDGRHWTRAVEPADGPASNVLNSVYGDRRGTIWIGGDAGIDHFERGTSQWTTYTTVDGLPSNEIVRLWVDETGIPWAGTATGLAHFDPSEDGWRSYTTEDGLLDNNVRAIWADRDGATWVATFGGVSRFDPTRGRWESHVVVEFGQSAIADAWGDGEGQIWLGTFEGELIRFVPETDEVESFPLPESADTMILTVLGDNQEKIWVSTFEGLNIFDTQKEEWTAQYEEELGPATSGVLSLWIDNENRLWAGGIAGLTQYDPQADNWIPVVQPSPEAKLDDYVIKDIWFGDDAGEVWLATEGGLLVYDPRTDRESRYRASRDTVTTDLRIEPNGDLWIATTDDVVRHWDAAGGEWIEYDTLGFGQQGQVGAFYRDQAGVLWAAHEWGVSHYDPATGEWSLVDTEAGFSLTRPTSLVVDNTNTIWTGSVEGLNRYDPVTGQGETYSAPDEVTANKITALDLDSQGGIWAAFEAQSGLARFDPVTETWVFHSLKQTATGGQAFYNAKTLALHVDVDDRVWAGTDGGLVRYDPATEEWQIYTAADGLPVGQIQAVWTDANDSVWAGSEDGGLGRLDLASYVSGVRPYAWRQWQVSDTANSGLSSNNIVSIRGVPGTSTGDVLVGSDTAYGRYRPQPPTLSMSAAKPNGPDFSCDTLQEIDPGTAVIALSALDLAQRVDEIAYRWMLATPSRPPTNTWHFVPNARDEKRTLVTIGVDEPGEYVFTASAGNLNYDWSAPEHCRFFVRDIVPPERRSYDWDGVELVVDDQVLVGSSPTAFGVSSHFWKRKHELSYRVPYTDNVTLPEDLTYHYNLGGITGTHKYNTPPLLELPPGEHVLNLYVEDEAGNRSVSFIPTISVPEPLIIRYLPQALAILLALSLLTVIGYLIYRRVSRFRYKDVAIVACPSHADSGYQIAMETAGWSGPPHDPLDPAALLPQGILKRLNSKSNLSGPDINAALETLGTALYRMLLAPEMRAYLAAQARRHHLRLRLSFTDQAEELGALPWELLRGDGNLGFWGINPRTALVRYQPLSDSKAEPSLKTRLPLRILVLISEIPGLPVLDIKREKQGLISLGESKASLFRIDVETEATLQKLQACLENGYDVVHWIGHGDVDEEGAFVYMLDEQGAQRLVTPSALSQVIRGVASPPKLVLFNACNTATSVGNVLGMAPVLIDHAGLPAVIGMQYPISDMAAARFTEGFYTALIHHGQVDYAVSQGRKAIATAEDTAPRDWACPVLYTQMADGIIFDRV